MALSNSLLCVPRLRLDCLPGHPAATVFRARIALDAGEMALGSGRIGRRGHESRRRGEGKPETFDFLGFTHMCGKTRTAGRFTVRRKTIGKRMRAKLQEIRQKLRQRMHDAIPETGTWLRSVVQGYFNYHAIPGNGKRLQAFRDGVTRYWWQTLRRRSQTSRIDWERMNRLVRRWIPSIRIMHPYPNVRFDATHPR